MRRVTKPEAVTATAAAGSVSQTVAPLKSKPHSHRCQDCGTIWTHGEMMAGDVEAHTCPKCGKPGQWRVYQGGQVAKVFCPKKADIPPPFLSQDFLGVPREVWGLFLFVVAAVIWGNLLYSLVSGE